MRFIGVICLQEGNCFLHRINYFLHPSLKGKEKCSSRLIYKWFWLGQSLSSWELALSVIRSSVTWSLMLDSRLIWSFCYWKLWNLIFIWFGFDLEFTWFGFDLEFTWVGYCCCWTIELQWYKVIYGSLQHGYEVAASWFFIYFFHFAKEIPKIIRNSHWREVFGGEKIELKKTIMEHIFIMEFLKNVSWIEFPNTTFIRWSSLFLLLLL